MCITLFLSVENTLYPTHVVVWWRGVYQAGIRAAGGTVALGPPRLDGDNADVGAPEGAVGFGPAEGGRSPDSQRAGGGNVAQQLPVGLKGEASLWGDKCTAKVGARLL